MAAFQRSRERSRAGARCEQPPQGWEPRLPGSVRPRRRLYCQRSPLPKLGSYAATPPPELAANHHLARPRCVAALRRAYGMRDADIPDRHLAALGPADREPSAADLRRGASREIGIGHRAASRPMGSSGPDVRWAASSHKPGSKLCLESEPPLPDGRATTPVCHFARRGQQRFHCGAATSAPAPGRVPRWALAQLRDGNRIQIRRSGSQAASPTPAKDRPLRQAAGGDWPAAPVAAPDVVRPRPGWQPGGGNQAGLPPRHPGRPGTRLAQGEAAAQAQEGQKAPWRAEGLRKA